MGKELGVDEGTVRNRIRQFQERGVLRGWYLGVNPGVTGHDIVHAHVDLNDESSKSDLVARLLPISDIERICNYLGPTISLVLFIKKSTEPDAELGNLKKLAGQAVLRKSGVINIPPLSLKNIDAEIIASLRADPWKPFATVGKELRVSERTVKRRLTDLSERGIVYMLPIVDLNALEGFVAVELVVEYDGGESRASVNHEIVLQIKESLVFSDSSAPYGYFGLVVPNVSHVEQITNWVNRLRGVRKAHAGLLQDVILNRNHYESWSMPAKLGNGRATD